MLLDVSSPRIERDMKEIDVDCFTVISWAFPERTENNSKHVDRTTIFHVVFNSFAPERML
jgi:hypothetical protein